MQMIAKYSNNAVSLTDGIHIMMEFPLIFDEENFKKLTKIAKSA